MDAFLIMLRNVILFAALAIPGYTLVKCNVLKKEHSAPLSKILMYVGLPFMIVSGMVNNLSINRDFLIRMLAVAAIGVIYTLVLILFSKPLSAFEKSEKTRGMIRFCTVFSNNGFLGIPLAIAVFGKDSEIFAILIVLNIINNIMIYAFGAHLVSGGGRSGGIKNAILNPVLIAFVAGLLLNLLKVKNYVPEIVNFSDYFSGIVTPISMTILGMKLAGVKVSSLFVSTKNYYVSFLKLIVAPVVIVALLFALRLIPGGIINTDVILAFFVAFAMPTAGLSTTFADTYDGDTDSAAIFTLGSTMLSILTIPLLYGLLNFFI